MSSNKETFSKTLIFVFIVCLVCAALVSISAVGLKDMQTTNRLLDKQTKILEAAGLLAQADKNIQETYDKHVEAKMIDLDSGAFIEGNTDDFEERRDSRNVTKSTKPVIAPNVSCCFFVISMNFLVDLKPYIGRFNSLNFIFNSLVALLSKVFKNN